MFDREKTARVLLEQLKWSVSLALGDDFRYSVRVAEDPSRRAEHMAAVVGAVYTARELVDEHETIDIPVSDWDQVKAGLNGLLGSLDRRLQKLGILPWGRRFRVRTMPWPVKKVYHVCPHKSAGFKDHLTWLMAPAGDDRLNFRYAHQIREIAEEGLRDPAHAATALHTIRRILNDTGAFGR